VRILTVDDSEVFLRALADVVRAAGFELVGSALSGEEGVRLHSELRPDVVLLDVHLPGIDGHETARRIERSRPATRVLLMSAAPTPGVIHKELMSPRLLRRLLG
jgi:two-component system, chemotaxis family, chemotaxis protein CheY